MAIPYWLFPIVLVIVPSWAEETAHVFVVREWGYALHTLALKSSFGKSAFCRRFALRNKHCALRQGMRVSYAWGQSISRQYPKPYMNIYVFIYIGEQTSFVSTRIYQFW